MTDITPAPHIIERRKHGTSEVLELVRQIHDHQIQMTANQAALDAKLTKHMKDETTDLANAMAALMKDSFPAGDPGGHRRHHEAVIAAAEEKAELYRTLRKEVAKWGLVALLSWMGYSLWNAFLIGPSK